MRAVRRALQGADDAQLPLTKEDFIDLIQLYVSFASFQFASKALVKNQTYL